MSEAVGITRQREGQISNRETVGGVERATLQSSHITEWIFVKHEDLKKRVLEAFLETCKIALKGRSIKFQHLMDDLSTQIVTIDGDEFAEADYGLVVDNSQGSQELNNKLDMLAQAALQNQSLDFSAIMKLYSSASLAEKQRLIENNERQIQERNQQLQQQQAQIEEQKNQAALQMKQAELDQKREANQLDNETKILIAQIQAATKNIEVNGEDGGIKDIEYSQEAKDKLKEQIREFDARLKLDRDKLKLDEKKASQDYEIKNKQLKKKPVTSK